MKRKPPIRWAAIKPALTVASFTRTDACKMSQTLIAPTRTNVIPSQRLAELLSMVWPVSLDSVSSTPFANRASVTTRNTRHRGHAGGLIPRDGTDTLRVAAGRVEGQGIDIAKHQHQGR